MACTVYVSLFQPSLCSASVPVSRQSRSLHLLNPFFQGRNAFSTGRRHQHVISADIGVAEDLEQKHKLKIEPYIHNMWYITYYKINMYIYIHILCICWSIYNSAYVYLSINSHMQSYNHLHNYYLVIHIYIVYISPSPVPMSTFPGSGRSSRIHHLATQRDSTVGPVAWRFQKIGFPLAHKLLDILLVFGCIKHIELIWNIWVTSNWLNHRVWCMKCWVWRFDKQSWAWDP